MLEFKDDKESELLQFVLETIRTSVKKDLEVPPEHLRESDHETSYGNCKKPFGIVRMRIVEFLSQVFQNFWKEVHPTFVECNIYNTLLFYFEHHPFHNFLHARVAEIINLVFDKGDDEMLAYILDESELMKKILNISKENSIYTFSEGV